MPDLWTQALATLRSTLDNQLVGGGLVLMLAGAAMALLRNVPVRIGQLVSRQFTVEVDVVSRDPLYGWLSAWLNEHPYSKRARRITASTDGG